MKLMICGKGGCGKSTVASLLAGEYAASGKRVLVVDADESNYGLHRQLGADLPKDFTLYFGSKKGVFQRLDKNDPDATPFEKRWTLDDIPKEYVTGNRPEAPLPYGSGEGGVMLMAVGKIHEAGEGCACPMGTLARHLIGNLDLSENDVVIVDAEAGVEHFGRGVDSSVNVILMIVDPSCESLMLSRKIRKMGESIGRPVYYVLNKINEVSLPVMKASLADPENVIAAIPENQTVLIKGLTGEALDCEVPQIRDIITALRPGKKAM